MLKSQRQVEIAQELATFELLHSLEISKLALMFGLSLPEVALPVIHELYEVINADAYLGRPMPKGFNDYDWKSVTFINDYYLAALHAGNFAMVLTTPFFQTLLHKFERAVQGSNKKISIFSCHQENLLAILTALGLTSSECLDQQWKNETISSE